MVRALSKVMISARIDRGCDHAELTRDADDSSVLVYVEDWDGPGATRAPDPLGTFRCTPRADGGVSKCAAARTPVRVRGPGARLRGVRAPGPGKLGGGKEGNGMQQLARLGVLAVAVWGLVPSLSVAQQTRAVAPLSCESTTGERKVCPADTSAGVALMKSTGPAACLLGKTWGYDDAGVWVADGCGGEFQLGKQAAAGGSAQAAPAPAPAPAGPRKPTETIEQWGEFTPGGGFLVGRGSSRGTVDQRLRARAVRQPDAW